GGGCLPLRSWVSVTGLTPCGRRARSGLSVERPEVSETLQRWIALHLLERLTRLLLASCAKLGDAQQQPGLIGIGNAGLREPPAERGGGLVVLLVAQVREAYAHVLVAVRRCGSRGVVLRQVGLVAGHLLLGGLEQTLVLLDVARLGEDLFLEAPLQNHLRLARRARIERELRVLGVVVRAVQHVDGGRE